MCYTLEFFLFISYSFNLMKIKIRTPISYYGWKQSMLATILPLIPKHAIYVEPFFWGGAVYRAKQPVACEVINDVNMNVVNFYEVLKHNYLQLRSYIEKTLHSRETYKKALLIYESPWLFPDNPIVRAWSFYVVCNQWFATRIGSWWYDKAKRAHTVQNKIDRFGEFLTERIKYTQIEQNDACKVIRSRDREDAFHYVDPPYINTSQGHYGGYTEEHYTQLLDTLEKVKWKFLLSSYPSKILEGYIKKNGRYTKRIDKPLTANGAKSGQTRKRKIEVLTANYPI